MTLISSGFHVSIFIRNVHHLKPSLSVEASHLQGSQAGKSLSSSPCRAALQVCTWNLGRGSSSERIHLNAHSISAEAFLPHVSLPAHQYLFLWWLNKIIYVHTHAHTHTCVLSLQSCLTLCDLWTVPPQAPLSMGFSRQKYWGGLPCPPPGDLPDPGIEPMYGSCTLTYTIQILRRWLWAFVRIKYI